jgi:hypothetical protein
MVITRRKWRIRFDFNYTHGWKIKNLIKISFALQSLHDDIEALNALIPKKEELLVEGVLLEPCLLRILEDLQRSLVAKKTAVVVPTRTLRWSQTALVL